MTNELENPVFTIGHSTHSIEMFIGLLEKHGIQAIADVRSSPYSRFNPHFNRENLVRFLNEHGIQYVFLGKELGARSSDPSCYIDGQVQYSRLAATPLFQKGLDRVQIGAKRYRIALMCAEREPLECHRTLLVARFLCLRNVPILHIHADGCLETHDSAMERLLTLVGLPKDDLFRSRQELLCEALVRQERSVAFIDESKQAGGAF